MNAPGSPSSALQMTYLGVAGEARQNSHFAAGREAGARRGRAAPTP